MLLMPMHAGPCGSELPSLGQPDARKSAFRFRFALSDSPPAVLFRFDGGNGGNFPAVFFAAIRQAFVLDGRLALAGARLSVAPEPRLFLRFTHPDGAAPLAEFANTFRAFCATLPAPPEAPPAVPAFELSAALTPEPGALVRLCGLIEESPFRLSELACDWGFRFGRRDEPDALVAEELIGFHFRLAFAGTAPEEAFFALLGRADPRWQLTCWRCGDLAPTELLRPALAGMAF